MADTNGTTPAAGSADQDSSEDKELTVQEAIGAIQELRAARDRDRIALRELEDANTKLTMLCMKLNQKLNLVMKAVDAEETETIAQRKREAERAAAPVKEAQPLMCGYMNKKGRNVRNWKRRWFVLKGGVLSYYEDKGKTAVKGTIPLETCIIDGIKERENTGRPCMALIVEGRTLYCQADSKKENMAWYLAINCMQQQLDYTKKTRAQFKEPDPRILSFFDHPMVSELTLDNSPMPVEAAVALESSLRFHTGLLALSLKNTELDAIHFEPLSRALGGNKSLTTVHLEDNHLDVDAAASLAKALVKNDSITELYLDNNPLGDEGIVVLAEAMMSHENLAVLSLNNVGCGDDGALAFATTLSQPHAMPIIQLNDNKIGDAGARGLADMLRVNPSVTEVRLNNNAIGSVGGKAFVDALASGDCNSVRVFAFAGNEDSDEFKILLTQMLMTNTGLRTVEVGDITLDPATLSSLRLLNRGGFLKSI